MRQRQIAYGIAADALGLSKRQALRQGPLAPELRTEVWANPAGEIRSVQAPRIRVDYCHDRGDLGEVVHIERHAGRLWVVAHVDGRIRPAVAVKVGEETRAVETPFFWSLETSATQDGRDIEILSVALTPATARICAEPVTFLQETLDYRREIPRNWPVRDYQRELLTRAAVGLFHRRKGERLVVEDIGKPATAIESASRYSGTRTRLEYRSAAAIDVSPGRREVDLLVAPAGVPAQIHERGRSFLETYAHGCFSGAEEHPERVRLNRDHDRTRTCGKAIAVDPWTEEGCVATFRIAKVRDGDEALELLKEDIAQCSAGFALTPNGDRWEGTSRRTILRARLDHVAVTADPAHATRVLDVRGNVFALH